MKKADAPATEDDTLIELARQACFEIRCLAIATRKMIDQQYEGEESSVYMSILARIATLAEVVHSAGRLDPTNVPDVGELQQAFTGGSLL